LYFQRKKLEKIIKKGLKNGKKAIKTERFYAFFESFFSGLQYALK